MSGLPLFAGFVLAALCAMFASGCTVLPLLPDVGDSGPSVLDTLPDAQPATAIAADGFDLRGASVVASPTAPVVLHLLPSGASVVTGVSAGIGRVGLASSLESLRQVGFSSVVFDYRGIGASEGRKNADQFLDDGRAMWREAVRLAGGHEDRVVIRAGSLGTLVAADLLGEGARPSGVILFAPIRSSSAVRNAVASRYGALWAAFASGVYKSPDAPDLEAVARDIPVPMLIVLPAEDQYFPKDEATLVANAAREAGHIVIDDPGDHQTTVLRSWNFEIDPNGFGGRRVETLTDAELRFLNEIMGGEK